MDVRAFLRIFLHPIVLPWTMSRTGLLLNQSSGTFSEWLLVPSFLIPRFFFLFFFPQRLFIFWGGQRETEHERWRGRERGRHRIGNRLQALSHQPRA